MKLYLLQVCLALRYYATGANYSIIGDFVGVSKSTVSVCVREVGDYFYQRQQQYMIFPNTEEQRAEIAAGFEEHYDGIPNCMGVLDGTHVAIIRPHIRPHNYINRKNFHSINAMVFIN